MEDSILTFLLDKLNQKHVLPDRINPDINGLMTLAELLSKTVDSDRFSSWCKFTCSVLNKIVNRCLKNGYTHASLTINPSMAQSCFNELMYFNSINSTSQDQTLLELIKASKGKNMNVSNSTSIIKKNGPLIKNQTCKESQKRSSDRISNGDSTDCDTDNEPRVNKRPALGNRFPAQVIERKKHNEEQLIKKGVNPQCLHEGSDESDELFKPSSSRTVVKSKEKLVTNKSGYSTKNSKSQISNDPCVSKQYRTKSRTLTHKLRCETSESESDEDTRKPTRRANFNKPVTLKDKIRNQSYESESDNLSDDYALSEYREGSGRTKKRYHKQPKVKNRVDSQDSESDNAISPSEKKGPGRDKKIKQTEPATKDKNPVAQNRGQTSDRKKPATRRRSSMHSDSSLISPVPKPKSRSHSSDAMLRNIKALQTESESSPSTKNKKDDIKSKSKKPMETANPKNKKEQKESSKPKGKPTNKKSPQEPLKKTSNKSEDSSKGKTKAIVKKNGKKPENKNEETVDKRDIECASSSKFVERLQQLESSILKGTPDPLEKNKAIKKKAPATQSQKNKPESTKSKQTVNSKIKPPSKNTKKSPAVKTQKKPANKKTPNKKAPTKKSQKPTNKSEDRENVESQVSKDINEFNREKTGITEDKSGAVALNQVQTAKPDNVDISEREDKNHPESFFSSEEDSELDSEPELGTLSACMNSIKRKMPRQTGTATPPLKIFLSSMYDAQSDILESEGSSFSNVPLKLDDKNVVKRMAKANKPKETNKQDFSITKLTKTPEALKKIMKLKSQCDAESSFECSSFSDDD